jgi:hypothetical protein
MPAVRWKRESEKPAHVGHHRLGGGVEAGPGVAQHGLHDPWPGSVIGFVRARAPSRPCRMRLHARADLGQHGGYGQPLRKWNQPRVGEVRNDGDAADTVPMLTVRRAMSNSPLPEIGSTIGCARASPP